MPKDEQKPIPEIKIPEKDFLDDFKNSLPIFQNPPPPPPPPPPSTQDSKGD